MVITVVILAVLYFSLARLASNGYGYMGYNGYHSGTSFWYWGGGPNIYYGRDLRSGSAGGSLSRGGGPGSGK